MDRREKDRAAFLQSAGWADADLDWRRGDASFRQYARLERGGQRAMLMDAPPPKERVEPFLAVGAMLQAAGLTTPTVLASDPARGFLLLEDFGDATFTALLDGGAEAAPLFDLATDALIAMRRAVGPAARALPRFDAGLRASHLSTFWDWLWPEALGAPASAADKAVLRSIWQRALASAPTLGQGFVHRDFHVDNLMRLEERDGVAACGVLDFQDAGFGPLAYDLASLVEDARRPLPPALKARCLARYRAAFPHLSPEEIDAAIAVHGGQRHMRCAGLWIRLWRRDGKPGYLHFMRNTWALLEASLAHPLLGDVRDFLDARFPADARRRAIALGEDRT